jgi:hypothetical protein
MRMIKMMAAQAMKKIAQFSGEMLTSITFANTVVKVPSKSTCAMIASPQQKEGHRNGPVTPAHGGTHGQYAQYHSVG